MHVIVIGYANLASRKQPNKILLQRDLFLPAYSRRSDLRRIFLPVVRLATSRPHDNPRRKCFGERIVIFRSARMLTKDFSKV